MKPFLALLGAVLTAGLMMAAEPGTKVSVDRRDAALADVIRDVETATGRKVEAAPAVVAGKTLTFVKSGTPDDVWAAFSVTLEAMCSITLVPGREGAWRLLPYDKVAAVPRPPSRGRRLTVDVVEGAVLLTGGQGNVTVRAGERSWVTSGALPAPPVPVDAASVAPWRLPEAPAAAGVDTRIPLPEVRIRLLGYTEKGDPILEYECNGERRTLDFGVLEAPEIGRQKLVIENGELVLPLNLRLKLDKGTNK
ncbi:MAG: hypothetical protein IT452_02870 [Planctomycetia bacterium]|nr:hypothetical protein [Planctomycetia bacterium]